MILVSCIVVGPSVTTNPLYYLTVDLVLNVHDRLCATGSLVYPRLHHIHGRRRVLVALSPAPDQRAFGVFHLETLPLRWEEG